MNSRNNPLYNTSGYRDPTAFRAIKEADGSRSKKRNPNLKEPSRRLCQRHNLRKKIRKGRVRPQRGKAH